MSVSADHANETWQEIQLAVESLSGLAREDVSPDHFYGELARQLCQITSASYCAIWGRETPHADGSDASSQGTEAEPRWQSLKESRRNPQSVTLSAETRTTAAFVQLIEDAAKSDAETCLDAGFTLDTNSGTTLGHDLILNRVLMDGDVVAVIEVGHEGDRSPSQREGARHLATVAAEIASDFQTSWQLRQLRDREQRREQLDRFLDHIHRTYDLRRVAYAVVADGKELIDCDRLSVVMKRGRRCRVVAVSGVQKPDRRSPTVQCMERFVKSKIRSTEPLWLEPPSSESKETAEAQYFAESNATCVGLLPLLSNTDEKQTPERIGTLLVEMFDHREIADNGLLSSRANWLARHASNAIANAARVDRLPLLGTSRWIDQHVTRRRRIPWLTVLSVPLLVALWFAAWMPTDFRIDARGELIPVNRESIYAPRPGTVVAFPLLDESNPRLENGQGAPVKPGDVVVRLESAELDYELTTLLGEQATVDQQLDTIDVAIGQSGRSRDEQSRNRYDELTAQAAELRVKQTSLARRIRLINKERDKLAIKAGIPGKILTWDVVNELMLRPVQQGDRLLEVVDVDGPWEIDLYVRDRHIGYVKQAQQERTTPLSISFFHRSDPEREYSATIKSIAMSTEVYPEYGSAVRVTGKIEDPGQLEALRPGTTVIAKVDCGKKPLAYVLGYDLLHTLRMWVLF